MESTNKVKVKDWEKEALAMVNQGYKVITEPSGEQFWILEEHNESRY